ncbi:hypothetical protein LTR84_011168 [Exophiala bonariae]|uniref:Peptidase A2 domain-containing protein n=1 Tax=Exophiala bonariae TaxID=1690606 RepID=A0AAV9NMR4_9EURO|nr:hypothetical protein LTR84_011168 [Exophiala bonariae]
MVRPSSLRSSSDESFASGNRRSTGLFRAATGEKPSSINGGSLSPTTAAKLTADFGALLASTSPPLSPRLRAADTTGVLLQHAARVGDVRMLVVLLDVVGYHPDVYPNIDEVTAEEAQQRTPLSWAAGEGHGAIVSLLLECSADLERKDDRGMTALHWAAARGHREVVEGILAWYRDRRQLGQSKGSVTSHSGNIEETPASTRNAEEWTDGSGHTPLAWAASAGHTEVVNLFLGADAEEDGLGFALMDVDDIHGRNPLSWAAGNGHYGTVKALLDALWERENVTRVQGRRTHSSRVRNRLNRRWRKGRNAESSDSTSETEQTQIHHRHADRQGWTPLTWAAFGGHAGIVWMLLQDGADANTEDRDGRTPLWWAASEGQEETVRALLEHKSVDREHEDKDGVTAVAQAIYHEHATVAEMLQKNEDASAISAVGAPEFLLWWAIKEGYTAIVASVLQGGADPDILVDGEWLPLLWAAANGDEALIKLLLTHGAKTDATADTVVNSHVGSDQSRTALSWAAGNGHIGAVQILIDSGAKLDWMPISNLLKSPLAHAAENGHTEVVSLLLRSGTDPQISDPFSKKSSSRKDWSLRKTPIGLAFDNGHLGIVMQLIDSCLKGLESEVAKVPSRSEYTEEVVLSWAARLGHLTAVKQLLSKPGVAMAMHDPRYDGSRLPLCDASEAGHDAIVTLLLEKGAKVDIPDYDHCTPLWLASANGHSTVVLQLIASGASLDTVDPSEHNTPLHKAAAGGHQATVSVLIDHGADIFVYNNSNLTPLSYAAEHGDVSIVNLLLGVGADPNGGPRANGETPLARAAAKGNVAAVTTLLAQGAIVNLPFGESPLSRAAAGGHAAVVDLLLSQPYAADPNAQPSSPLSSGKTTRRPLLAAADSGNAYITCRLLEFGAEVDAQNETGEDSALCHAAVYGHEEVVRLLLDHGAVIEPQKPTKKNRPIVLASKGGSVGTVKLLLERGAGFRPTQPKDSSSVQVRGSAMEQAEGLRIPLEVAAKDGHHEVVALLLDRILELTEECPAESKTKDGNVKLRPEIVKSLDWAKWHRLWTEKGKEDTVRVMLASGADPNATDSRGRTPLFQTENVDIARLLLEAGALPDLARDHENDTALSKAAQAGASNMVKLLLEYKADIEAKDVNGQTPLSLAARFGNLEMVKLLLDHGANLETKDLEGLTPLSWAGWTRNEETVAYLLERHADPDAFIGGDPSYTDLRLRMTTPLRLASRDSSDSVAGGLNDHYWRLIHERPQSSGPFPTDEEYRSPECCDV